MKVQLLPKFPGRLPLLAGFPLLMCVAQAATITFESAADLSSFNRLGGTGNLTHNDTGKYITYSPVSNTSVFAYDLDGASSGLTTFTVPADGSLTVSADVRFSVGGPNAGTTSSFGIFFGSYLGLLNVSSANDILRIGTDMAAAGGVGTFAGSGVSGVDFFPVGPEIAFTHISATMTPVDAGSFTFSITAGTRTYSQNIASPMPTDFQLGFRAYNVTGTTNAIDIDNFTVNLVPEPSSALLLLGALPLACLRRRGRN